MVGETIAPTAPGETIAPTTAPGPETTAPTEAVAGRNGGSSKRDDDDGFDDDGPTFAPTDFF